MLLTLSTSMPDAADLGYLLHKHPDRTQAFSVATGTAHVFWPEVSAERSTVALLLEVDPIDLVRGRGQRGSDGHSLAQYVNDRPYAASSMLAVALGKVFRTALTGRCHARPDLVGRAIPLQVHLPALPSRGGPELLDRFFAPLGWEVGATRLPLDPELPAWGDSDYHDVRLTGTLVLADALTQLYVLLPVLDDAKHYWVSADEIDKLVRAGGGWLADHPERELIVRRYLKHQRSLVTTATARLAPTGRLAEIDDGSADPAAEVGDPDDAAAEPTVPLARLRTEAVLAALHAEGAASVVDLGCGEGRLLAALLADPAFTKVTGADVSHRALELAERHLALDRRSDRQRARLELIQSSATYRDDRLAGYDALVLMEVIEHLDPPRLPALERTVFDHARPTSVLVTTPNAEHNVRFSSLSAGALRHRDHRFEWSRAQFRSWADTVAVAHGYAVRYLPVGLDDPEVGPATQLAVFRRTG